VSAQDGAFITVRHAAKRLGVSPSTAYRLVAAGEIPSVVIHGRRRVPQSALVHWIESQAQTALASIRGGGRQPITGTTRDDH
jgi:excisionase family DNA binding protein